MRAQIELSVLQNHMTQIYGLWPLGFQITFVFGIILNNFLAVVYYNVRSFILAILGMFLLINFFRRFADVHCTSEEAISSWRELESSNPNQMWVKWFKKFRASCRPIRINIGEFFYVDKTLVLTIIYIIINNSATLILTYKETHM